MKFISVDSNGGSELLSFVSRKSKPQGKNIEKVYGLLHNIPEQLKERNSRNDFIKRTFRQLLKNGDLGG